MKGVLGMRSRAANAYWSSLFWDAADWPVGYGWYFIYSVDMYGWFCCCWLNVTDET